jgi:hypothetical protein
MMCTVTRQNHIVLRSLVSYGPWGSSEVCLLTLGPFEGSSVVLDLLRGVLAPTFRLAALDGTERFADAASRRATISISAIYLQVIDLPFLLVRPGEDASEAASSARFLS